MRWTTTAPSAPCREGSEVCEYGVVLSAWSSAATMPRWASRLTVEVVALRVEPDPWEWVAELEVRP